MPKTASSLRTISHCVLGELSILNYIRKIQQGGVTLILKLETSNKKHLVRCDMCVLDISEHLSTKDIFPKFQGQGHLLKFSWSGELLNRKCYNKVVNQKVVGLNMTYLTNFVSCRSDQYQPSYCDLKKWPFQHNNDLDL